MCGKLLNLLMTAQIISRALNGRKEQIARQVATGTLTGQAEQATHTHRRVMPYTYNPFINNFDYYAAVSSSTVFGPGSSTDDALVRWNGTTGTLVKNSVGILSDAGALTGLTQLVVDNITVDGDTVATSGVNLILSGNGFATGSFGFNVILSGGTTTISQGVVFGALSTQTTDFTTGYSDHLILVDVTTGGAPITAQLVNDPIPGQEYVFKDSTGAAATHNITVSGTVSGKNIDGATTSVINVNYGSLTLIYNGVQWNVV